jgi:5-(carboxyamino)imidazole ribonucleotide synthase
LAMRPHNSGHWTIDGARTSQFEQHLRAVLDLPLGAPDAAGRPVVMANVFGGSGLARTDEDVYSRYTHVMAADPGARIHMYGKTPRPGRKIGHVTVLPNAALGDDIDALRERAGHAARYLGEGKD